MLCLRTHARKASVALAVCFPLTSCSSNPVLLGPMEVRNQHPVQLTALHMPFTETSALPSGAWRGGLDTAYSNLFLGGFGSGNTFAMDGEYLRVGSKHRVGLGGGFELFGEVAMAHTTPGFLDSFVIEFHEAFGFPSQGRDNAPRDQFGIVAQRQGASAFEVERSGAELLDLPLGVKWTAVEPTREQPFGVALRGAVELPTGDERRGYGNGGVDAALGLVAEYRGASFGLTAHAQHTFVATPDRARSAGLDYGDVTSLGLAVELPLSDSVSGMVATEWETSVLRELDFGQASDPQWLLWTGFRFRLEEPLFLEVALGEDISPDTSPDFTAWISMRWLPDFR